MNKRLLLATSAFVAIATSAFAQSSPNTSTSTPTTAQRHQDSTSTTPSSSSSTTPSSSAPTSAQSTSPSSTNSAQTQSPAGTGQSNAAQSTSSGTNTTQAPTSGNSSNQAQTSQPTNHPANQAQTNQPSNQTNPPANQAQTTSPSNNQTQSANPPPSGSNQAQSPAGHGSTDTAQHSNSRENTADQSSNTNVNASVNINDQQRTRISQSISHLNVQPLNSVNFSLSVGTAIPRDVRLQPLPSEVVELVPQYRGYNFVLVKDEIVIVEPSSYKIVAVLPYSGRSTATAPARSEQRKTTFSERDREVIRKHARARPVERGRQTTGTSVRTEIRTGERVPEGVEVEAFPEEVYREAPSLREYRYIHRDSRTYVVEPQERRVIEEID